MRSSHSFTAWLRVTCMAFVALPSRPVAAQAPPDDAWPYTRGELTADIAVISGVPAALPTGLARGAGGGVQWGRCWMVGVRAAWLAANEATAIWQIDHDEVRLRAIAGVQRDVGRAVLGVRLAAGGTLVAESRLRQQGMRAGLSGDELETSRFALLPAAQVDGVVGLHIRGPWLLQLSGGPGVVVLDGSPRAVWSAEIGVAWQR